MFLNVITMIAPELVAEQHFFLEELTHPFILWGIRGACVIGGTVALIIYYKMKKKGE